MVSGRKGFKKKLNFTLYHYVHCGKFSQQSRELLHYRRIDKNADIINARKNAIPTTTAKTPKMSMLLSLQGTFTVFMLSAVRYASAIPISQTMGKRIMLIPILKIAKSERQNVKLRRNPIALRRTPQYACPNHGMNTESIAATIGGFVGVGRKPLPLPQWGHAPVNPSGISAPQSWQKLDDI